MKKLILITLVLTLAMGMVWLPSVAAATYAITIYKTIPAGGPEEDFTFKAYRDMNNNGIIDFDDPEYPDVFVGEVVIKGAGTDVIDSPLKGRTIIHEELIAGSAYQQLPDQIVQVPCGDVTFENRLDEFGQIKILKLDQDGNLITVPGAEFEISPNPKTCEPLSVLTVVDEGLNDEALGQIGVLLVNGCLVCCKCTVTETKAPDGYSVITTPQQAHVTVPGETVTLEFVNLREEEYGQIKILKVDPDGNLVTVPGATFEISPNPKTCKLPALKVVDEGLNDEALGQIGVLLVSGCLVCCECTVTETVAPPGYELDPTPQPAHVTVPGETVTLEFVNTPPELSCGTVCAAQTGPGETLFGGGQSNWFTWIYYYKGWGTESDPYEYPIYTGITTLCGTLYVYDDGTHIFVNYVLTDTDTCTLGGLSQYHLQVDDSLDLLKKHILNKPGNPVSGKCRYKGTLDPMQPETGWIETTKDNISKWSDPIYIFAHGVGCYNCP